MSEDLFEDAAAAAGAHVSAELVESVFERLDEDGDGLVDYVDWRGWVHRHGQPAQGQSQHPRRMWGLKTGFTFRLRFG